MWIVYIDDKTNDLLGFAYASTFYPKQGYDKTVETTIYVRNGSFSQGVGYALYDYLFSELKAYGYRTAIAVTEATNISGLNFHTKFGF